MKEEKTLSAETSGNEMPQVDEYADVDQTESVNDQQFTDAADNTPENAETGENKGKDAEDEATKQRRINAEYARRRREQERKKELEEVRVKAIIGALGKNPYTHEEMRDATDVDEYLLMKQIEEKGGDPLADYAKYAKNKKREETEKKQTETVTREWYDNDKREFASKYPDVKIDELIANEQFRVFAEGKVGVKPLATIYGDYLKLTESFNKTADERVKKALANKSASPGALNNPQEPSEKEFYTRDEVQKMSSEEVHKNFEKIKKSMSKW